MQLNLTRSIQNRFLRPLLATALFAAATPLLLAQNDSGGGGYQGPGIATQGAPETGTRGGQPVDLRFFAGVSGAYDSSLQPLSIDAKGNVAPANNLYGVEVTAGAYGTHNFKRSQLGLNYNGSYRRYSDNTYYNGTDQTLALRYAYQSSRRVILQLNESLGTLTYGNTGVAASATSDSGAALDRSAVFFDSRFNYLQSTASLTLLQSAKTSYTMSGTGFRQDRKESIGLTNSWGYDFMGGVNRRISRTSTIGGDYMYSHFEFPTFGMLSDTNAYHATWLVNFARTWTFSLQAGAAISEVRSPFTIALSPVLAALLGRQTISGISYVKNTVPSGAVLLRRQFSRAVLTLNYGRGVISGNGYTTTSRQEFGTGGISYVGLRRASISIDGGYYSLSGFGQAFGKVSQYSAGIGGSYALAPATHLTVRYDYRDQQVDLSNYALRGSRVTVGIMFSPGNLPLSIW